MKLKGLPRKGGKGKYWDPQGRGQAKFLEQVRTQYPQAGEGFLRRVAGAEDEMRRMAQKFQAAENIASADKSVAGNIMSMAAGQMGNAFTGAVVGGFAGPMAGIVSVLASSAVKSAATNPAVVGKLTHLASAGGRAAKKGLATAARSAA